MPLFAESFSWIEFSQLNLLYVNNFEDLWLDYADDPEFTHFIDF